MRQLARAVIVRTRDYSGARHEDVCLLVAFDLSRNTPGCRTQESRECSDRDLVQRQFTAIEQLVDRAESGSYDAAGTRYRFEYPKFWADLARVRHLIKNEFKLNQPGATGWFTEDHLWLVSKTATDK